MRIHSYTVRILTTGLLVLAGSLAALVAARPASATSFLELPYTMPAVFVFATSDAPDLTTRSRADVAGLGSALDAPRHESISNGAVSAAASASLNAFFARALCGGPGVGKALSYWTFNVEDPQGRGLVYATLKAKAAATVSAPPVDHISLASWRIDVGVSTGDLILLVDLADPDNLISPGTTFPVLQDATRVPALSLVGGARFLNVPVASRSVVRIGQVVDSDSFEGSSITQDEGPSFPVAPGLTYVIALEAYCANGGLAVVDPVIVPDPANPDVIVHVERTVTDPAPQPPLDGLDADALRALGLDPTPFEQLGMFDLPTETQPETSTTTTTEPSPTSTTVTTTTLPGPVGCPDDDVAGLECLCLEGLADACPGETIPSGVTAPFATACRLATDAVAAGPGRRGRKTMARSAVMFGRVTSAVRRPRVVRGTTAACRASVAAIAGDAMARASRVVERF